MRRIQQLLAARIVYVDDVLYFSFKKHTFTAQIAQGGLIWRCTWQKPGHVAEKAFQTAGSIQNQPHVRTFESLTDWTETCIQELLDEYHTRYSSWKRVRHQRTDQPMEIIYKHYQRSHPKSPVETKSILLYEQIAGQKNAIEKLQEKVAKWIEWYETTHPNKPLPVEPITSKEEPVSEQHAVQPFVLTSDTGQYMVLHRMNEIAPDECVSWLKKNGPHRFQNMLKNVKQAPIFEPVVEGTDNWNDVDQATSIRFIHDFFNN
jgi:hypothetical protein